MKNKYKLNIFLDEKNINLYFMKYCILKYQSHKISMFDIFFITNF